MKPIIAINLSPRNYPGLINLGNRVIVSMTGSLTFTTPNPALSVVQTAVTDVENAYAAWAPTGSRGSKADLLDLRNKALTLYQLLIAESQYVQITAQLAAGSDYSEMAAIIGTSGFELKKAGSPQGVLEQVQGFHRFVSRQLAVNELKLKWKKPLNLTSRNNVHDYRIMRGTTTDFTVAVEIGSVTRTSFVDVNNTNAPQKWTYWIVPFKNAGLGVPSDALRVTVLNA